MDTPKAFIAGLVITLGLLAVSLAFEGIAQVLGPEDQDLQEEVPGDDTIDFTGDEDDNDE